MLGREKFGVQHPLLMPTLGGDIFGNIKGRRAFDDYLLMLGMIYSLFLSSFLLTFLLFPFLFLSFSHRFLSYFPLCYSPNVCCGDGHKALT